MEISIVSGTYNRLNHLKRMVQSVRKSIGNLAYEIVLVDGGSNDGTIAWCKKQGDVVLIEQGELVGAIRAFNAGCWKARGRYVAILNDDIEVVGGTLKKAHKYLECHPQCGQVAFENRPTKNAAQHRADYSHSYGYLYGQCCLTRGWVGNTAGWWGPPSEGLHTYGGDSRLGMRIWEMGYTVDKVAGCAIIDHVVDDQMRRDRTKLLRPNPKGGHKDTRAFRKVWDRRMPRKNEWIPSPVPRLLLKASHGCLRTMRYRHMRLGTKVMRSAQIDAFRKLGPAKHIDHSGLVSDHGIKRFQDIVKRQIANFRPDLVMFQAHGDGNIQPDTIRELKVAHPHTYFVNFDGDFHNPLTDFHYDLARASDLQLLISPDLFSVYANHGATSVAWMYPATEDVFIEAGASRPDADKLRGPDVICLMNRTPPAVFPEAHTRINAVKRLYDSGVDFKVYGIGWDKEGVETSGVTYNDDAASAKLYRNARMCLSVSQAKKLYGYTSNRAFFAGAVGIPILMQEFEGMDALGYVDGDTVIAWNTFKEMEQKIEYYLAHPDEREDIGKRCREMTLRDHTYDQRCESLLYLLEGICIP